MGTFCAPTLPTETVIAENRLVVEAATSLGVTPASCIVIGDSWRDMQLARALGVPGLHVQTGPEKTHDGGEKTFPDVLSAVDYLIETIV